MSDSLKLALFFLLCLMFALLFNLPVQQVLPHVKLPTTVRLIGVNGAVTRGTVQEISINGLPMPAFNYRFLPSCIPRLKICYKVSNEQGTAWLAYDVLNGDTEIRRARIEYPVTELVKHISNVPLNPIGKVELVIDELSMVQGKPVVLQGKLTWQDMGFDNEGSKIIIGDYLISFTGDGKKYVFKLNNLDDNLDVLGKGEVKPDGQYSVDIKIAAENGIDPQVKNVLDLVAAKAGYNHYRFEKKGRLPPKLTRHLF